MPTAIWSSLPSQSVTKPSAFSLSANHQIRVPLRSDSESSWALPGEQQNLQMGQCGVNSTTSEHYNSRRLPRMNESRIHGEFANAARLGRAGSRGWSAGYWTLFGVGLIVGAMITRNVEAENFSLGDPFLDRLSAPVTSIMDGRSFRDAVNRLAQSGQINVWIDRRVDPSVRIQVGQLGPNRFTAINQVAEANGCVAMPVENVLLIGPAQWVEGLAESIWSSSKSKRRANVSWPRLSTPTEALASVNGKAEPLPHDLWPAVKLIGIRRAVAEELIRGQFAPARGQTSREQTAKDTVKLTEHLYRGLPLELVRSELRAADPKSRIKKVGDSLSIAATARGHRIITQTWLTSATPRRTKVDATFSLRTKVQAGTVITQLAQAAQWKCTIKDSAIEACQSEIRLEAKDKTLKELIELACGQAGVNVAFGDGEVVITGNPRR